MRTVALTLLLSVLTVLSWGQKIKNNFIQLSYSNQYYFNELKLRTMISYLTP